MFTTYQDIRSERRQMLPRLERSPREMEEYHDKWIRETVYLSLEEMQKERGQPPAPFAFFLLGSAARGEQGFVSDQDHGLIYKNAEGADDYFLSLGYKISNSLDLIGYDWCEGGIMAANSMFCKEEEAWRKQFNQWLACESWEDVRYIFLLADARTLVAKGIHMEELTRSFFSTSQVSRQVLKRIASHMAVPPKGTNIFGQLLPVPKGPFSGSINLKTQGLFPYVNGARLAALYYGWENVSTFERLSRFEEKNREWSRLAEFFQLLLAWRTSSEVNSVEQGHFLALTKLTTEEKHQLKQALKIGRAFFLHMKRSLERGGRH